MDATTARRNLEAELRRLTELHRTGELDGAEHGDAADEGADLYEREVERALDGEVLAEVGAIEAALARLDAGTYGRCEACSSPIADERLEAVPATRFCRDHELEAETHRGGGALGEGRDAIDQVRREAQAHLGAAGRNGADDLDPDDDDQRLGAEDDAVHVRPS